MTGDWAPEDFEFHQQALRLLKGLLKAYEEWQINKRVRQRGRIPESTAKPVPQTD